MSRFQALDLGLVVAAHGRHAVVETPEGRRVQCHPRGKKSELVVGDRVRWAPSGDEGVVEHLEPRRSLLYRQDDWRTKSFAANLDQLLVLVASSPVFSESQLARALVAAADAGVPAVIGLNKTDLPDSDGARARLAPYRAMGVEVVELAAKGRAAETRERLAALLDGRITLLLGPSGAGKSTLVNLLVPGAQAQTGEISQALNSGRHTTTATRWYWLDADRRGALIDSPGFQEFGLRHIAPERLASLMPDLAATLGACRFHNCTHRHEPGCGVRTAVESGAVAASRYRLYVELYDELARPRW
ncbi:MAG: ribosome small subunit-dependent GTPase A [Rubrivivax sp.]|nr:ribosome small subunit-dependent GTPase A [Rubrivivax sp.]